MTLLIQAWEDIEDKKTKTLAFSSSVTRILSGRDLYIPS